MPHGSYGPAFYSVETKFICMCTNILSYALVPKIITGKTTLRPYVPQRHRCSNVPQKEHFFFQALTTY